MSSSGIQLLTMPKWGLAMKKGKIVAWLVGEGANVSPGLELVEVETEKVLSSIEAPVSGVLRRKVAQEGEVVPVAGLVGVIADASVPDSQINEVIAEFHTPTPEEIEEIHAPALQIAEVQGQKLCYIQRGAGPEAVILIHGFGGDLNNWMLNHDSLAEKCTVYALDLPGHGNSSKQVGKGTLTEFACALNGFMDAVGVTKAHLIGHSMGGAIAIFFAIAHPERALSLTLIASAGLGVEINNDYIQGFISASRRKEIKPHLEKLFADPRLVSQQLVDDILRYKRLDGVEPALRMIANEFCPGGRQAVLLSEQLSQSSVPVLVIWGAEDRILPVSHAQCLAKTIRAEILPGCGHMVHMEAAPKVNQIIYSFWESLNEAHP